MSRPISLADFDQIKLISAKVASVKINKTKVPAFLCSLDVGPSLLEVQLHLRRICGRCACPLYQLAKAQRLLQWQTNMAAYVLNCFGDLLTVQSHLSLLVGCPSDFVVSFMEPIHRAVYAGGVLQLHSPYAPAGTSKIAWEVSVCQLCSAHYAAHKRRCEQ